jgi:membrane protein YqaA with SNARE-associated domain
MKHHHGGPVIAPKKEKPIPSESMGTIDKTFIIVTLIAVCYTLVIIYQKEILVLLQKNPYVWVMVSHIFNEISTRTLLGLFYACFFGSLFFIMVPLELLFLYYHSFGYPAISLVGLTIIAVTIGLFFDYVFGWILGKRVLVFLLREKFHKFHRWIGKWGSVAVFIGTALPFPIQPVSVIIGAVRFPLRKFIIFAFLGSFVKYTLLIVIGNYLMQSLIPWIQAMF